MNDNGNIRKFETGATRDSAQDKPDYEGFLCPLVLEEYGKYMLSHQKQPDGNYRASDNWQKGIPRSTYIKSLFRHFHELWKLQRGFTVNDLRTGKPVTITSACCAIMFNVMGYLHEFLKAHSVDYPVSYEKLPQAGTLLSEEEVLREIGLNQLTPSNVIELPEQPK